VTLYRVTMAVSAERLPQVHSAVMGLASVTEISHWYDDWKDAPETLVDAAGNTLAGSQDSPAMEDTPAEKVKGDTLVNRILQRAARKTGVTRKELKAVAIDSGFNVGSVSPTLVKLIKDKKILRIAKGVYAIRELRKA
jgi:hypothetical protein